MCVLHVFKLVASAPPHASALVVERNVVGRKRASVEVRGRELTLLASEKDVNTLVLKTKLLLGYVSERFGAHARNAIVAESLLENTIFCDL